MHIKKKKIGGKAYFYLGYSLREGNKVVKKEVYLGSELPKNLEEIKIKFMEEMIKEKYLNNFEIIKKNFSKESKGMPKSAREKYLNYFLVKFTYDTNRIEGSTITLKETARILDERVTPKNKPLEDIKETEAHKKVFEEMISYDKDLSLRIILKWHQELLERSKPDIAGKIRGHQVKVAGSKTSFPFPAELDTVLKEFIDWYRQNKEKIHPVELAALVHLKFVSIHPFSDGNGRISRLLMNFVLHRNVYPMLNIKYLNRSDYYNALERAQVKKEDKAFILHIFRRYLKEYNNYLIK